MKRLWILCVCTLFLLVGCSKQSEKVQTTITQEQAKTIALEHAGLTEEEVTFTKEAMDQEGPKTVYEFEFYFNQTEYEYEIDATTKSILSSNKEEKVVKQQEKTKEETIQQEENTSTNITQEKAIEIAKETIGIGDARVVSVYSEVDDGQEKIKVILQANTMKYEVEIDQTSGAVIEVDQDSIYDD